MVVEAHSTVCYVQNIDGVVWCVCVCVLPDVVGAKLRVIHLLPAIGQL